MKELRFPVFIIRFLFWIITLMGLNVLFTGIGKAFTFMHLVFLMVATTNFYSQSFLAQKFFPSGFSRQNFLLMAGLVLLFWIVDVVLLTAVLPTSVSGFIKLQAALVLALFFSFSAISIENFRFSIDRRQKMQQLENEKTELELSLVRSRLNPHFLFNVLNNIDHYIRKDPLKASQSIIQLSSLLRYLLYDTAKIRVPLEQEVAFLEEYIDLQKQRIQEGNTCTFKKEITEPGLMVAPALFLPFLENAFSHCPLNQPGNFLYFELIGQAGKITFIGRNSRQLTESPSERVGLGLDLARKRLTLLYPDTHQLYILETDHHFSVELVLQVT